MKIPKHFENRNIILSMAGTGNPWDYFRPSSKLTLRALFDGYSLFEIQKMFQISEEELFKKLNLLLEAKLLKKEEGKYYPDFLIVDEEETKKTFYHARDIGKLIADELESNWNKIETQFSSLDISRLCTLEELSLVLVGSKILDIGLLNALVKDRTLLLPAPKRPSPKRPDAQYYFFMVEGETDYLGKYGEDSKDLPWENWTFVTFGQNRINGKPNKPRNKIEETCTEILQNEQLQDPLELADKLNVTMLSKEDSLLWHKHTKEVAHSIMLRILERKEEILQYYQSLKVSKYTNDSQGEFIGWYIHIAYSWAIDFLVERKIIAMPSEKFGSLIIYTEGLQGVIG